MGYACFLLRAYPCFLQYHKMVRRKINFSIPGLSFSWKRALGITQVKRNIAREIGIPTSKSGLEHKIGKTILKTIFGKLYE